jgi:hypothetical protein
MNKMEIARLLTAVAALDNRKVLEETVEAWYAVLHAYPYSDAAGAVRQHFEDSTEYLMPAHIKQGIKRTREARNPSNDTTPGGYRALHAAPGSAPMPANWNELCAAWNDPVKWAVETGRYDEQLVAAGFPPVERWSRRAA